MIRVENLTKDYGDRAAISDLSFEIAKGEIVGFLGPNGAGKTTTMKILTGFMAPTSGSVLIGGVDVFEDPISAKSKIGYLPETPPLYTDMTVVSYLKYVAGLRGVARADLNASVNKALESLNLKDVQNRLIGNLSKGFRQRVGIAQAIVSDPEVLILDEPTVGLDPKQVAQFRALLNELRGKHTIILSTHILPEVQASCERVIIINEGRIVAKDSLKALSEKSKAGMRRVTFRVQRVKEHIRQEFSTLDFVKMSAFAGQDLHVDVIGGDNSLEELSSRIVSGGLGLLGMEVSSEKLEDVFIEITRDKGSVK
jgi:ABC-2 type transport system ATP-binding protein